MSKFYLYKYPVTSVEGNEYAVSIYDEKYSSNSVRVSLYKKVRGFFGKEKFKCLTGSGNWAPCYDEKEWRYDYIEMAINEIIKYENSIKEKNEHENKRKVAFEMFEKWSGKEESS
ncbi:hypothetical protein VSK91_21970 [Bacillus swezeyi]|uniref:hypothetical protein n=1 Tax=Bacillus swezeyi TaxID=1925020 RepID=UPI0039C6AC7E